ncbi:unnamed protein product [Cylindrotheca closterium]|uniref:C-type lectin domain-containing protein n=1 Tax=Cylindrotheca closterium TaxID=2856 RepID=A0AAD2G1I3_9STRA|nr:unnamed protein product [Cylindrotheca closterium]
MDEEKEKKERRTRRAREEQEAKQQSAKGKSSGSSVAAPDVSEHSNRLSRSKRYPSSRSSEDREAKERARERGKSSRSEVGAHSESNRPRSKRDKTRVKSSDSRRTRQDQDAKDRARGGRSAHSASNGSRSKRDEEAKARGKRGSGASKPGAEPGSRRENKETRKASRRGKEGGIADLPIVNASDDQKLTEPVANTPGGEEGYRLEALAVEDQQDDRVQNLEERNKAIQKQMDDLKRTLDNRNNDVEEETEDPPPSSSNKKKYLVPFAICAVLAIVIAVVVVFAIPKGEDDPSESNEVNDLINTDPDTDNPTVLQSASPTESPTASCTSLLFEPPSLGDCIAIRGQREVAGQDAMKLEEIEMVLDISLFDENPETDTWRTQILTFVEEAFTPSLAGCDSVDSNSPLSCIRYVVANAALVSGAMGQRRALQDESCEDGAELPCQRTKIDLNLFLKGDVSFLALSSLILEDVDLPNLLSAVFSGDSVIQNVKLIAIQRRVEADTLPPTASDPSSKIPSEMPSMDPTRQPVTFPTTEEPTKGPSKAPSAVPSAVPTLTPTTPSPTMPDSTPGPTAPPSKIPTRFPTPTPTQTPTLVPVPDPTPLPTATPSRSPSRSPTEHPSISPSPAPTVAPSDAPSSIPTCYFPIVTPKLYFANPDESSRANHTSYAATLGMTLATVRDTSEYEQIRAIYKYFEVGLWLGAAQDPAGIWQWDGDNCPFYTATDGCLQPGGCFWNPGEPNSFQGLETALEFKEHPTTNDDFGYNDFNPTMNLAGIYEKPLSSVCKEQAYYCAPSMTYAEHVGNATAMGMSLAKVKDLDDHLCITGIVSIVAPAVGYVHFLGGNDSESDGVWKWEGETDPFYTTADGCLQPGGCFWRSGEPNNFRGPENALVFDVTGWGDYPEEFSRPGIYVK